MRLVLWTCLAIAVDLAASARILAVLPMPAQSHHHLFRAVLKTLAERGHQIISYTPLPMDKPVANYTEIHLDTLESAGNTSQLLYYLLLFCLSFLDSSRLDCTVHKVQYCQSRHLFGNN